MAPEKIIKIDKLNTIILPQPISRKKRPPGTTCLSSTLKILPKIVFKPGRFDSFSGLFKMVYIDLKFVISKNRDLQETEGK